MVLGLWGTTLFKRAAERYLFVMAGLVPAIHVFSLRSASKDVDARHKAGHDEILGVTPPPSRP